MKPEDQAFLARTGEEAGIQRQKFLILLKDGLNFSLPQINILTVLWFDWKIYRKLVRRWRNMGETSRRGHFIRQVRKQRQSISLNKTNYLIYEVHFKLLKLFFFKTWFYVRKMAIVSVSSHSLSTRIDCSVFSLRRSKSSLMVIRAVTDTFI